MKIDFYAEFPTKESLEKLKLIKFNSVLFMAAKSFKKFKEMEKQVKKINKKIECGYWPIIKDSYWVSPFSNTEDLIELFEELKKCNNRMLIDLELPFNKRMIIKNFFSYFKNRKIIKDFLKSNQKRITTAQFPSPFISLLFKILGLDYSLEIEKTIMWYSSMNHKIINYAIKKSLIKLKDKHKYSISLGTIAIGILGYEKILSPEKLEENLEFIKKIGFNNVVIFRLVGLNKKYMDVIDKFA